MNIRNKLFIMICLISIIPLTAVGLISMKISKKALEKHIGMKSLEFAQMSMKRLNEYLYSKYSDMQSWAEMDEIKSVVLTENMYGHKSRLLKILRENHNDFYYIVCLNSQGRVTASTNDAMVGMDFSANKGFMEAIKGKTNIQDVEYNEIVEEYAITFSVPIMDIVDQYKVMGVLLSAVKWKKINKMNSELEIRGKRQDEANHVMLTNRDGLIISCDNPAQLFTNNLIKIGMKSAKYAKEGKEGYLIETSNHGLTSLATYTYFKNYLDMPNPAWLLILLQEPEALFASVNALQKIIIAVIISTIILSFIVSLIIASTISNPIVKIASAAQAIGKGDMERRVFINSEDEIGDLSRSFNKMAEDLKVSRDELILTRDYVDNIIKSMIDILIVIDTKGTIKIINEATCSLLGYSKEELIGKPIEKIFETDGNNMPWIKKLLKKEAIQNTEMTLLSKDSRKIPISFSASIMHSNEGDIQGIVCVAKDLTERKKVEKALQQQQQQLIHADKMASLGILVSGVAHEIHNPNNFIMFNAPTLSKIWNDALPIMEEYYKENGDFVLAGLPYTEAREIIPKLLSGISDGSRRIKSIVRKLKKFAHKNISGHSQFVDINSVIKSAVSLIDSLIKKSTNHFLLECQDDLPPIRGNSQELEQVIINLISNSCQALNDMNDSIHISTSYDADKRMIVINIIDEGIGIPQENIKKIMEPFFTTKRDSGGTGLGLYVSYNIIKDHGGKLQFESDTIKGTAAAITLPVLTKE